ncbi:L-serine dehydratase (L-serine deaminase) [Durusdinium trenchii]|uniref:L-serine ammonia-lyase n=1 Tax=Durusdinium trenchii TaxID=1381693 RepID=A0ABP0SQR1_9DINO
MRHVSMHESFDGFFAPLQAAAAGAQCIVSSSGGNAGLAAAFAARNFDLPCTVVLPTTTPQSVQEELAFYGAKVMVHGSVWDEADQKAREVVKDRKGAYVHPFDQEVEGVVGVLEHVREIKGLISTKDGSLNLSPADKDVILSYEQPKSAHMAEMHALIWATWWIYRVILSLQWHGEVHFVWDACAAGGKADGDYYSGDSLGSILRCLQQALQAKGML